MKAFYSRCFAVFTALCIIVAALAGCADSPAEPTGSNDLSDEVIVDAEHLMKLLSFEDLVAMSDSAVLGEYISTDAYENYVEHRFKVESVYFGDINDEEIYLFSNIGTAHVMETDYEYSLTACPYEVGKKYILIMSKNVSIMFPHDRYVTGAQLVICPEDDLYSMYSAPIQTAEGKDIVDYLSELPNAYAPSMVTAAAAEYGSAMEKAVSEAGFTAKVSVDGLYFEGEIHNGNTYLCSIDEIYKGGELVYREDGKILLVILKNTVEVGKKYIVCFSQVGPDSLVYKQQTIDSVYEASDDAEMQIKAYLE